MAHGPIWRPLVNAARSVPSVRRIASLDPVLRSLQSVFREMTDGTRSPHRAGCNSPGAEQDTVCWAAVMMLTAGKGQCLQGGGGLPLA
jgi:hypothetical protein